MKKTAWINNTYQPYSDLTLHVSDLSIQRGYAIFDFMLERNGRVAFIEEYINRFMASAALLALEPGYSKKETEEIIYKLLQQNGFHNSSIKLLLTGGYSEDGYTPVKPNFIIINHPFAVSALHYKEGVSLITAEYQREMPEAKHIDYVMSLRLLPQMKAKGALDVLYYRNRHIYETSRCNFFLVKNQTLITPASGMLHGITRNNVLKLAKDLCRVEERNVAIEEIRDADEAFITCTTRNVMPVTKIDETVIGNGQVGNVTALLGEKYNELLALNASS